MLKNFSVLKIFLTLIIISFSCSCSYAENLNIPANHWARNAVMQLEARGIINNTNSDFRGEENSTRYEFAVMLARTLENLNLELASENDLEILRKLVNEFKSELDVLNADVSKITGLKNNLAGWRIHGQMRFDITGRKQDDGSSTPKSEYLLERARMFFEREFDKNKFVAMIDTEDGILNFERFYVTTPLNSNLSLKYIVGRFKWDFEEDYHIGEHFLNDAGGFYSTKGLLTDRIVNGIGIIKNFSNGIFRAYTSHPNLVDNDWEIAAALNIILNERVAMDFGAQVFIGENSTELHIYEDRVVGHKFEDLWTVFAGIKLNFGDGIFVKGIFYDQQLDVKDIEPKKITQTKSRWSWLKSDEGTFKHWAIILELPKSVLKIAKLWLEYGHFDRGFKTFNALNDGALFVNKYAMLENIEWDLNYLRVALSGEFRKNLSWHLFYYAYNIDADGFDNPYEAGLGFMYRLNDSVSFGINYIHADNGIVDGGKKDDFVRFRTEVEF